MRQIALDTETTGLDNKEHRIIEIGAVELINRRPTGQHYHQYINPEREVDQGAFSVHGLSNEFLRDKPKFVDIMAEFIEFVDGAELVIHNAPFDVGFLNMELQRMRAKPAKLEQRCQVLDTLVLARKKHMGQRNSLDALCKRYGVDNSNRQFHGALLDAELLADVYLLMTGGQVSLFLDESTQSSTEHSKEQAVFSAKKRLKVIKATAEELKVHDDSLA